MLLVSYRFKIVINQKYRGKLPVILLYKIVDFQTRREIYSKANRFHQSALERTAVMLLPVSVFKFNLILVELSQVTNYTASDCCLLCKITFACYKI